MINTDHVPTFAIGIFGEREDAGHSGCAREPENKTKSRVFLGVLSDSWLPPSSVGINARRGPVPESSQLTQNPADVTTLARRSRVTPSFISLPPFRP